MITTSQIVWSLISIFILGSICWLIAFACASMAKGPEDYEDEEY